MDVLVDLALVIGLSELLRRLKVGEKWNLVGTIVLSVGLGVLVTVAGDHVIVQAILEYLRLGLAAVGILTAGFQTVAAIHNARFYAGVPWD